MQHVDPNTICLSIIPIETAELLIRRWRRKAAFWRLEAEISCDPTLRDAIYLAARVFEQNAVELERLEAKRAVSSERIESIRKRA